MATSWFTVGVRGGVGYGRAMRNQFKRLTRQELLVRAFRRDPLDSDAADPELAQGAFEEPPEPDFDGRAVTFGADEQGEQFGAAGQVS